MRSSLAPSLHEGDETRGVLNRHKLDAGPLWTVV
jgi:hypothetical protein